MSRHHIALLAAAAILASSLVPSTASAINLETNRFAERPSGQGVSSSSVMERTYVWPSGTGALSFDYFVDSEPNFDLLKVYVDNVLQWSMSGLNKAGHKDLSVSAGSHTVKFEYVKDGSVDRGQDTAWVDNVSFLSSNTVTAPAFNRFNTTDALSTLGWTPSGASGGWAIPGLKRDFGAGRPGGQVGVSPSTSYMEKTLTWSGAASPWSGAVAFDYFVDSEPVNDTLQVLVDSVVAWTMSGRYKSGHQVVRIAGAGNHTVRFQYVKNGSLSEGSDTARVNNVRFINGDSAVLELNTFDGRDLETTPIAVAAGTTEWTSGGSSGGWVVHREIPPVLYVPRQTDALQLIPRYKSFAAPTIDGEIHWKTEYLNPTMLSLFNFGDPAAAPGVLGLLAENNASNSFFVAIRAKGSSTIQGNETGQLTVLLDGSRSSTLSDVGSCAAPQLPGAEDRQITITYAIANKGASAILSATELKGDCAGAWVPLAGATAWLQHPSTSLIVKEPLSDPGFVHIEMELWLPAAVVTDGRFGLGLQRSNTSLAASEERLPTSDAGGPLADDVYTWSTIGLAMPALVSGFAPTMTAVAQPDRPHYLWVK